MLAANTFRFTSENIQNAAVSFLAQNIRVVQHRHGASWIQQLDSIFFLMFENNTLLLRTRSKICLHSRPTTTNKTWLRKVETIIKKICVRDRLEKISRGFDICVDCLSATVWRFHYWDTVNLALGRRVIITRSETKSFRRIYIRINSWRFNRSRDVR